MTKLSWDQVGERLYETGLDHGVLYLPDSVVPWNGITGLVESFSDESAPYYLDGVKRLDSVTYGEFAAALTAFTYPDEFFAIEGELDLGNGLSVDGQTLKRFDLSYRTLIGNDVEGTKVGYKIHILYNLTAVSKGQTNVSLSQEISPVDFSWDISSVPASVEGYRPTSHIILDSRFIDPILLALIEDKLYGTSTTDPVLPSLDDLFGYPMIKIIDNGDGSWTARGPSEYITMTNPTTFKITHVEGEFLNSTTYHVRTTY